MYQNIEQKPKLKKKCFDEGNFRRYEQLIVSLFFIIHNELCNWGWFVIKVIEF